MQLDFARAAAELVVLALHPFCERIEIAGSIRRQRPEVNDIDLVLLPEPGQLPAIKARCLNKAKKVLDGDTNFIVQVEDGRLRGVQLDIFIARPTESDLLDRKPGNFGSLWLCRTGSKEHNIYLVERAKQLGMRWNPYHGIFGPGKGGRELCVASETEEEIFAALKLEFVPPEERER